MVSFSLIIYNIREEEVKRKRSKNWKWKENIGVAIVCISQFLVDEILVKNPVLDEWEINLEKKKRVKKKMNNIKTKKKNDKLINIYLIEWTDKEKKERIVNEIRRNDWMNESIIL